MELFKPVDSKTLPSLASELARKLESGSAAIGVVGLGYVGLPIALEFARKGYRGIGVDLDEWKVSELNAGKNYIEDLPDDEIAAFFKSGKITASNQFSSLAGTDVIFICVPTPFNDNKDPDISYILDAGKRIGGILKKGQLVILKSTTFPGTTENFLRPELESSGLKAGKDFFLAYSPERVDPGNKQWQTSNTPIVVGGIDPDSTYLAALTNFRIIETIYTVTNPKIAELEKLLENIFRSVNIALVNELSLLCERMAGINIWEVIEAAGTKPFGFMKFFPGPGIGGHCIPIDPYYLSWLARAYDFETRFITLSANVNESMPYHVVNKVISIVASQPISLMQSKVLVLGVAFKKNVKDLRHSPAEPVMRLLRQSGVGTIEYSDPWVPEYKVGDMVYSSVPLDAGRIGSYDCVLVVTDHDAFDKDLILKNARNIVDTRNLFRNVVGDRSKIVLLGQN